MKQTIHAELDDETNVCKVEVHTKGIDLHVTVRDYADLLDNAMLQRITSALQKEFAKDAGGGEGGCDLHVEAVPVGARAEPCEKCGGFIVAKGDYVELDDVYRPPTCQECGGWVVDGECVGPCALSEQRLDQALDDAKEEWRETLQGPLSSLMASRHKKLHAKDAVESLVSVTSRDTVRRLSSCSPGVFLHDAGAQMIFHDQETLMWLSDVFGLLHTHYGPKDDPWPALCKRLDALYHAGWTPEQALHDVHRHSGEVIGHEVGRLIASRPKRLSFINGVQQVTGVRHLVGAKGEEWLGTLHAVLRIAGITKDDIQAEWAPDPGDQGAGHAPGSPAAVFDRNTPLSDP